MCISREKSAILKGNNKDREAVMKKWKRILWLGMALCCLLSGCGKKEEEKGELVWEQRTEVSREVFKI